jgi:hypothetical protein
MFAPSSSQETATNLGVAKEMEGEYDEALKYYQAAAATHSGQYRLGGVLSRQRGRMRERGCDYECQDHQQC